MRWALVLLVTLVLAGLWVLAYFAPELRWFAELLTVCVVVAALLLVVVPVLLDRRKKAAAEAASKDVKVSTAPALTAFRQQVRRALGEAARVRGGRGAARRLPCYLVLSHPESGTEGVLLSWGLANVSRRVIGGELGSSPAAGGPWCDAWCSQDAVAIAVDPRVEREDWARDAWTITLDEIRRARGGRSVAGVIVTVGLSEVTDGGAQVSESAGRMGAKIEAVLDRLGVIVPVYLLLTRADSLPGFSDFWADLPRPDDSCWGASFAIDDDSARREPARAVEREIDTMALALHSRLFDRLTREADPTRRVRALRFPLLFRGVTAPLAHFVGLLCRPGGGPDSFLLRGFYFVGASQGALAPDPGGRRAPSGPSGGDPSSQPFFLGDVFRSVLLPDRHLAGPTRIDRGRKARGELTAALIAVGTTFFVLVPALASYVRNVDLAGAVQDAARALQAAGPSTTPGMQGDPIELALDTIRRCRAEASGWAIPGWFSPRAAIELRAPLSEAYVARLHAWMNARVRPEIERQLDAISVARGLPDAPASAEDETPLTLAYDLVRLDATLVDPARRNAGDWAAVHLAAVWRHLLGDAPAVSAERLTEHAHNYLDALAAVPTRAWPNSRQLLAARDRLRKLDVRGVPYRRVLLAAKDAPAVRASSLFSPASLEFLASRGDVQIPGAFTASGWPKIRDTVHGAAPLPPSASIERWVLDDASLPQDEGALRRQILEAYFDEYTRRWMSFLDELKVKTPTDVDTAKAELVAFKQGDGFYKALFGAFKENAIHDDEPASSQDAGLLARLTWFKTEVDAGAKASPPSPVEKSFRPVLAFGGLTSSEGAGGAPVDKYLAILDRLKAALEAPPPPKAAGSDPRTPFTEASTGVAALLDGVEEPTRGRLWRLLMPPVMGGVLAAKAEGVTSLSGDWRSAVWTAWDQKLRGRTPFARSGHAEPANFADFAAFFRPDGILWGFVHTHLADAVEANGEGRYGMKPGADPLAGDLLSCLTIAQEISDAFFNPGEEPGLKLSVQADWTASDVETAKFVVGSKETALPRAQWAGPVRWFGEDVRVEWMQGGRPTQELGRHSFSLFDLFEHLGGLRPSSAGRALYACDCPPLTLKVRPEGKVDPLRSDFFSRLHCPPDVRGAGP